MRWIFVLIVAAGCELAPTDPRLEPLATFNVEVINVDDVAPPNIDALVTWYLAETRPDQALWSTTERVELSGPTAQVPVLQPPPAAALFGEPTEIAVGFLSIVERQTSEGFNWSDPFEFDVLPTVAGSEEFVIVYLESRTPWQPPWDLEGGALAPGFNLVRVDAASEQIRRRLPMGTPIQLEVFSEWFPRNAACGLAFDGTIVSLPLDDPEFADAVTRIGDCSDCGETFATERCEPFIGDVCGECVTLELNYDPSLGNEWPCIPEGDCLDGEEFCALHQLYRCTSGRFVRVEDCTASDDCCQTGCTALP